MVLENNSNTLGIQDYLLSEMEFRSPHSLNGQLQVEILDKCA